MPHASHFFVFNLLATWYLVGLIWMVQIVHYPLLDRVGSQEFEGYEQDHNRLITPVVGVVMLLEIATSLALLLARPSGFPSWAAWLGVGLVLAIWMSTALIQVPCHSVLLTGFQESAYRRLVQSNWIRTICWTGRGILLGYFCLRMLDRT